MQSAIARVAPGWEGWVEKTHFSLPAAKNYRNWKVGGDRWIRGHDRRSDKI